MKAQAAAVASATVPAFHPIEVMEQSPYIARYPKSQPPSHRPPQARKSQLHRQYTSLLRSSPIILLFQHNNLLTREWTAIRRELAIALSKVDEAQDTDLAHAIKLQAIQASIFESALRVTEYYQPPLSTSENPGNDLQTHSLSSYAHDKVFQYRKQHPLTPLLVGPIATLAFPSISPPHLKAALQILAPNKKAGFAAPPRRLAPALYETAPQNGLQKLMLLGAKVEGKIYDQAGVQYVGGLDGIEGLRAQLVAMLSSVGGRLVQNLEAVGTSLWLTVEGRRMDMEKKEGGTEETQAEDQ